MRAPSYDRWLASKVEPFPDAVRGLLLERFHSEQQELAPALRWPSRSMHEWLHTATGELRAAKVHRAFDEQRIRDYAENYSRLAARIPKLADRSEYACSCGVDAPAGPGITEAGAMARLGDPLWWRRQLRKVWTRAAENGMRDIGAIRKGRAPYSSDEAVRHRRGQKRRMRSYLEGHQMVNELGEQLPLLEVAERSIANPAIRRGEFMTRVRGFEEIAADLGHVAQFWTLTTPSTFHAQLSAGGRNPAYDRQLVRDAQAWLCKMWARARAKLKRLSVLFYGFRIAEPHHDATPHWHLLLFTPPRHAGTVEMVVRSVWLGEFANESGAAQYRTKLETIDPSRGSAAGYIAKYVSKNIDGAGTIGEANDDETGQSITSGIERVDAWASIHGIRQFQQIGGPPVGLWREFRRLRVPVADRDMERVRKSADDGSWSRFVDSNGGIAVGRRTHARIETCETGARNRYGEARPAAPIGVRYASAVELTRHHIWRIERKNRGPCTAKAGRSRASDVAGSGSIFSALGPVAITVRGAGGYNAPTTWSNPNETSQAGPNAEQ